MDHSRILVSLPPDQLRLAGKYGWDVELKLSWEHYPILSGQENLYNSIVRAGVDPSQIRSVHLPPGTETRGTRIGMSATPQNKGTILGFVHQQLGELPDPYLVVHPQKDFVYAEQLAMLNEIAELTKRDISVENTSDQSHLYTIEDVLLFAYLSRIGVGKTGKGPSRLFLTIDSAHLPQEKDHTFTTSKTTSGFDVEKLYAQIANNDSTNKVYPLPEYLKLDREAMHALIGRLEGQHFLMNPSYFESYISQHLEHAQKVKLDRTFETDPYNPLLETLLHARERVKSIHLNDPVTNDTPDLTLKRVARPALEAALKLIKDQRTYVVLEPRKETLADPSELFRRVEAIDAALS